MQYLVRGTDRETGQQHTTAIEAINKADADQRAEALGWIIESVIPYSGRAVDDLAVAALDYRRPSTPPRGGPPSIRFGSSTGYADIRRCAKVLRFVGFLFMFLTSIMIVIGLTVVANARADSGPVFLAVMIATMLLVADTAILFMMAGVGMAIRDIAINSFWRPPPPPKPTAGEVELELEQRTGASAVPESFE